ncbi:hypothetical protein RND71_018837 [Anisodus tanguticus]|uniref:Uncharacterized protein n=1 Tax=Anisodus tanguticus TaxID=243964 RepID=A0AAE1VH93_9SOLA|nr:hypothetical protein RND71_018837 [Anisodus tanguticus]
MKEEFCFVSVVFNAISGRKFLPSVTPKINFIKQFGRAILPIPTDVVDLSHTIFPCLKHLTSIKSMHLSLIRLHFFTAYFPSFVIPLWPGDIKMPKNNLRLIAGKRRRRGSRSVSGRSSDRSGTHRRRCCSVGASAAYGTCSDFPVAVGTDSSGELFVNGDMNWTLDVSEVTRNLLRKEKEGGERESSNLNGLQGQIGNLEGLGNESGYGSEPGYRGDAEFGYGDELDEEEDDQRLSFWGDEFGALSRMEKVGENSLQKVHHRCRRRKQDCRMSIP